MIVAHTHTHTRQNDFAAGNELNKQNCGGEERMGEREKFAREWEVNDLEHIQHLEHI